MLVLAFNPSTSEGRGRWISKFKASLVYRANSMTAKTTQRNSVSKQMMMMMIEAEKIDTLEGKSACCAAQVPK